MTMGRNDRIPYFGVFSYFNSCYFSLYIDNLFGGLSEYVVFDSLTDHPYSISILLAVSNL